MIRSLNKSHCLGVALIVWLSLSPPPSVAQQNCALKKENEGLKVYTCDTTNEKLKILRAELILRNTTFEKLLSFVEDIDNYVNWQYNTVAARLITKSSHHWLRYRMVVDAPWPLADRELVAEMNSRFDSTSQTLHITTRSVVIDTPVQGSMVRIPFSEAKWRVTRLNQSSLKIDYTLRVDPGGYVPAWLANMAMAEGPFYSFSKLKEYLQE
jgi:hypothetical protein